MNQPVEFEMETEEVVGGSVLALWLVLKKRRSVWMRALCRKDGEFVRTFQEAKKNPEKFFSYTRMSLGSFSDLMEKLSPALIATPRNELFFTGRKMQQRRQAGALSVERRARLIRRSAGQKNEHVHSLFRRRPTSVELGVRSSAPM